MAKAVLPLGKLRSPSKGKKRVRRPLRRGRLGSTPWGPGLQVPFCQEEARAPDGKGKHSHWPFGPQWRNKI